MHRVVFLDRNTLAPWVKLRRPSFPHDWAEFPDTLPEQVVDRLQGADVVIVNKVRLNRDILSRLPDLRLVAVAATGTDNVDLEACAALNIAVCNIRGYSVHSVPEHTFALMLALRRSLIGYRQDVQSGEWARSGKFCFFSHPIADLHGATLGIVGAGAIGRSVAQLAGAFGMRIQFAGRKGAPTAGEGYVPFDEMLASSDVISLHCPLQASTRHLLSDREFDVMTKRPIIINTARGGLIDEAALIRALREGKIAGAGLDVASAEPLPSDHPMIGLLNLPNVILTPHVAWASTQSMQSLADQLIENVELFVAGTPRNLMG